MRRFMPKIALVAGARPNFIKIAPIIREINASNENKFETIQVHTGQHYDYDMSLSFFEDLGIPKPDYFLHAGSGSHAKQTAKIMIEFEKVCTKEKPDLVIVVGDVNSTLACSITAKKLNIKVAHVESGLRSNDFEMPEEINRIVTDSISDYLFVSEKSGCENLKAEGKYDSTVFFVGNVMIDTLFYQLAKLDEQVKLETKIEDGAENRNYAVITLHRPSNVDEKEIFTKIIEALAEISRDMKIVFPAHPRTKNNIERFGLTDKIMQSDIELIPPQPYIDFLKLWKDASLVLTDSGGLQEETTALGIPCFTIRKNTERPITIEEGTNILAGTTKESILSAYSLFKNSDLKKGKIPKFWDGKTSQRIVSVLKQKLARTQ